MATAVRLLFLAVDFGVFRDSLHAFFSLSDAGSYLAVAQRIYLGWDLVKEYDTRVFPGWPLMFGWTLFLNQQGLGMMALTVLMAGCIPCLFYRLTRDYRMSALLCYFPPAWLLQSIYPMGEAAFLFCGLISLICLFQGRFFLAGLAIGSMIAVRPHGVALAMGEALILCRHFREWRVQRLGWYVFGIALPAVGVLWLNQWLYSDVLHQVHVYGKNLGGFNVAEDVAAQLGDPKGHWGFPLFHVLTTPWRIQVPIWKTLYVYAHVLLVLAMVAWLAQRAWSVRWREISDLDLSLGAWFLGNTALILSTGPYWGFHSFDRYVLWAWPAMLWFGRRWYRGGWKPLAGLCLLSVGMVAFALGRRWI